MIKPNLTLTNEEVLQIMRDILEESRNLDPSIEKIFQFMISLNDQKFNGSQSKALNDKIAEFMKVCVERCLG